MNSAGRAGGPVRPAMTCPAMAPDDRQLLISPQAAGPPQCASSIPASVSARALA